MQNPKSKIDLKNNQAVFWVAVKNYPLEAIQNAAYVFIDRVYVYLDGDPDKEVNVFLKGKNKLDKKKLEALKGEFLNELLNYLVRTQIAKRNKKIREFIVGSALIHSMGMDFLSNSNLEDGAKGEWQNDPLGIAVPWEDKYEKKNEPKEKEKISRKG